MLFQNFLNDCELNKLLGKLVESSQFQSISSNIVSFPGIANYLATYLHIK